MPNRSINHTNAFSNLFFEQNILQFWAPPHGFGRLTTKQSRTNVWFFLLRASDLPCMQNVVNSLEKTWTPYFLRRLFLNLKIVSVPYPLLKSQKIESIIWQWQAARSMNRTCQNMSTLLTTAQICQKRARSRLPMKNGPSIWLHDRLIQVLWNWSTIQKHIPSYTIKVITNKNYNRGKRTALYLMKTCAFFIDWTQPMT